MYLPGVRVFTVCLRNLLMQLFYAALNETFDQILRNLLILRDLLMYRNFSGNMQPECNRHFMHAA